MSQETVKIVGFPMTSCCAFGIGSGALTKRIMAVKKI